MTLEEEKLEIGIYMIVSVLVFMVILEMNLIGEPAENIGG